MALATYIKWTAYAIQFVDIRVLLRFCPNHVLHAGYKETEPVVAGQQLRFLWLLGLAIFQPTSLIYRHRLRLRQKNGQF